MSTTTEDPTKIIPGEAAPAEPQKKEEPKQGDEPKTFTQEDIDRIAAKTRAEVKAQAEKEIKESVAQAVAEEKRLAKLSAEEKEKEMLEKQAKMNEQKERDLTLRENKLAGIDKLSELKLPIKFVEYVLDTDLEKMNQKIELMNSEWKQALSEEVARQTKGEAPTDPKAPTTSSANTDQPIKNYI